MLLQMTQSFYTRLLGWQIVRNLETYTLPPPPQRLANCSGNSMPLFLFNLLNLKYYESICRAKKVDWKIFLFISPQNWFLVHHASFEAHILQTMLSFLKNCLFHFKWFMGNVYMSQQMQKSFKYINTLHREEQWRWWGPYSTPQEWLSDKRIVQTLKLD